LRAILEINGTAAAIAFYRMFRRSGHRSADRNMRQMKASGTYSDSAGTEYVPGETLSRIQALTNR
jgi:hypothetical protein